MVMIIFTFLLSIYDIPRHRIIYIDTPNKTNDKIPLTDFKVDVEVSGTAAEANYTLKYKNIDNNTLVEAKLKFPFDTDVTVSDVSLQYKNQTIIGQIMKRSDAKVIYDNEKQDKNVAMLVQREGDFISIDLAGIGPNETFTAKISTFTVLDLKFEHKKENFFTRYIFPTSMIPRYSPPSSQKSYENPFLMPNVNYSFQFNLKTTSGQISPESALLIKEKSTGKIEWNDKSFSYSGEVPNDVIIDIITKKPDTSIAMTIEHYQNSTVTEISIPGSILLDLRKSGVQKKSEIEKKESFVFLIDRSGSMYGQPIQKAKSALELFLHSIPTDSVFEIVGFGSSYEPLFGSLVEYNDTTLETAVNYARSIDASMGGTEMLEPLKYILPKYPDHLIFLTDGAVSNVDEVKSYCGRFSTQISTIAIGNFAAKDLLKTISVLSLGTYELVQDMSQIEGAVIRSLSAIKNSFSVTSIKGNCGVLYQSFPILLLPETAVPFRFFNQNGQHPEKVQIELTLKDCSTRKEFNLSISQDDKRVIVSEIYGKKLHCVSLVKAINEDVIDENEAFNQSLRLGIMTKHTSFILVDKRSPSEKVEYQPVTVEIPVKIQSHFKLLSQKTFHAPSSPSYVNKLKSSRLFKMTTNLHSLDLGSLEMDSDEDVQVSNNLNDKCSLISSLQKANGNWNLTDILNALNIKLDENVVNEWKNKNDKSDSLLACLFAIEHLKNNCGDLYKFVIEKGNSFINSNFSKQMIDSALKIVKSY